ncbi:GNAT family N-acetyltransferase [Streptomyces sp. NPDC002055]|uniref:GNAT family N-acetyltransferase n=1 Tax=Streptomyces sp. NPDC002055 TaxID=3154534 RepID=UPI00331C505B
MAIPTAVVPVSEIFELRRSVLRAGLPAETAVFPEDSDPDVFHIAAYDGSGALRACGTFFPDPLPEAAAPGGRTPAYRFRGLASDPEVRGQGYGQAVLAAGLAEIGARDVRHVWCNGRTPATGFYQRQGFTRLGEEFVLDPGGAHYVFVRELTD